MKNKLINLSLLVFVISAFEVVIIAGTSLYWEHQAVIHHSAFFEASSWGNVSFHWNDVSYAHAPFQDSSVFESKMQEAFNKTLPPDAK
jgi:hypothetical protein